MLYGRPIRSVADISRRQHLPWECVFAEVPANQKPEIIPFNERHNIMDELAMSRLIHRSHAEPERHDLDWNSVWKGADSALIKSWEIGRKLADQAPALAACAKAGELPPLNWKGGVSKKLKKREKFGSLHYLAQWQGLRGQDLEIDMDAEITLTCAKTGMVVTFTPDLRKLANQQSDSEEEVTGSV